MDFSALLSDLKQQNKTRINEVEAKDLLKEFDVPVVPETVAANTQEAVAAADAFGYPVVVKGLGAELAHKTELGIVHLDLKTAQAVQNAVETIAASAGDDLEGFVVQPQIKGQRELVAGLFRDPQFGPIVMFGLGGIFTEALADVSFRLAPMSMTDATEMLSEIRAKAMLGPYRGEKAIKTNLGASAQVSNGTVITAAGLPGCDWCHLLSQIHCLYRCFGPDGQMGAYANGQHHQRRIRRPGIFGES